MEECVVFDGRNSLDQGEANFPGHFWFMKQILSPMAELILL